MTPETNQKIAYLISFVVISCAVVGYFVGLQSPMNPTTVARKQQQDSRPLSNQLNSEASEHAEDPLAIVVPATDYADMRYVSAEIANRFRTRLDELSPNDDLMAEVSIKPGEKEFALQMRGRNRAFNGAPPTIPHAIDQLSSQTCMACHGSGFNGESLRISKMSHQFLPNCTQCHVENTPQHMPASLFEESEFVGLPAPTEGPRAYEGAPPMIPHSTWMRVDCLSCHGPTSLNGMRTTHPWRQNCQQCHAPSSALDQLQLNPQPEFLAPLKVKK